MNVKDVVLKLLRCALWKEEITIPLDTDWAAVYDELKKQAVMLLTDQVLMEHCPDEELKQKWKVELLQQLSANDRNMYGQFCLLELLKKKEVPVVILKGTAAAQYYPCPEKRILGDVDFIVPKERFWEILAYLKENGYVQISKIPEGYCEVALVKDKNKFELHRGLSAVNKESIEQLEQRVLKEMHSCHLCTINGYPFPVLPHITNGLVLLAHIRQHLIAGGIGLRQILDWMLYVKAHLDDCCWNNSFQKAAREYGLEKLAIGVTRMCQVYLGLTETNRSWCMKADMLVCEQFMEYIFEHGNFGRKLEKCSSAIQRAHIKTGIVKTILLNIQKNGHNREIVLKYKFLRPFAWLVQIVYLGKIALTRKNPLKTMHKDVKKAQQIKEMFEAMDVHI